MPSPPFSTPQFGESLPIQASPSTIDFLSRRRSASAVNLAEPGPTEQELRSLLNLAARAPDHGKLAPWRFVILRGEAKTSFVRALESIAATRADAAKAQAKLSKLRTPPVTVAVVSRFIPGEIPEWEQRLSSGAVCTLLIVAAQAMGFGANWITDWYAYDDAATRLLGLRDGERVAGYIHLGSVTDPPMERVRPELDSILSTWAR